MTTELEELVLPIDEEAEAELETLVHLGRHDAVRAADGAQDATEHEQRLERAVADAERMVVGIGRAYLRDGRALARLARQRELLNREIDVLEEPIVARRLEAEGYLQRVALMQREASKGKEATLTIPTVGKVKTKRTPSQVKVADPAAFIGCLNADELATIAPWEEPKPRERKVIAAEVKKAVAKLVESRVGDLTPEQQLELTRLPDDERELRLDAIRAELVAALYEGLTFEPTQIGATIEVNA